MESVRDKMASRQQDLKLYLEYFPPEEKLRWTEQYPEEPPIMIFMKHFDAAAQTLTGVGHFYVHKNQRVVDVLPQILSRAGLATNTPVKIWEVNDTFAFGFRLVADGRQKQEIKPNMIELMKPKATFLQSEIQDGDILCFQADQSEAEYVRSPNVTTQQLANVAQDP
jgi:ubiquitin carboxyl-terminal hydrolase 7